MGEHTVALAEEDKARIRAEEIFREEVRRSLPAPAQANGASRLLRALNSPFTLWLLSTVVVAGATAFYTQWKDRRLEETARAEAVERLDTEISYRFSRVIGAAKEISDAINHHDALVRELEEDKRSSELEREYDVKPKRPVHTEDERKKRQDEIKTLYDDIMGRNHPLVLLTRHGGVEVSPLYPEYQSFNLAGLLVELRRKVRPEHGPEIERVLMELTDPYFDPLFNRNMRKAELLCVTVIRINELLLLDRWRNTGFPYVNCPPDNPFCRNFKDESGQVRQLEDRSCFRVSEEERRRIEQREAEERLIR